MSKRKQNQSNGAEDDSDSDVSLIDVDFDFFDPNPSVDYHALKRLISQLFQSDAESLQLHEFTELILSQPRVGTTIKTDGMESDPYAFLTVLNLHVHQNHPSIKALIAYILAKASSNPQMHATLQSLIGPAGLAQNDNHVGFVFCERLINMPVQVIPPMYKMLTEEIKWALDDNEPYKFTHLIFISRTYRLSADEEAAMMQTTAPRSSKRKKPSVAPSAPPDGIYSFHPEDEYIIKFSSHHQSYPFSNQAQNQPRDKESFGLDTGGRLMLVPSGQWEELVTSMAQAYAVEQ